MAHAVAHIGDFQSGHDMGLWHPDALNEHGTKIILTPYQQYLWDCFLHCRTVYLPSVIGKLPLITALGGDLVDSIHHDMTGALVLEHCAQIRGAVMLAEMFTAGSEHTFAVGGTGAHAGRGAEWDNEVARQCGATPDETGRYAPKHQYQCIDGVVFDWAHPIGGSFVPQSDMTPVVREYVTTAVAAYQGAPRAHVSVRWHAHNYRIYDKGVEPYRTTVIDCPGWQAKTWYAETISRGTPLAIGLVVVIADEGKWEVERKLYAWPRPKMECIGWTPDQTQSPISPTRKQPVSSAKSRRRIQTAQTDG